MDRNYTVPRHHSSSNNATTAMSNGTSTGIVPQVTSFHGRIKSQSPLIVKIKSGANGPLRFITKSRGTTTIRPEASAPAAGTSTTSALSSSAAPAAADTEFSIPRKKRKVESSSSTSLPRKVSPRDTTNTITTTRNTRKGSSNRWLDDDSEEEEGAVVERTRLVLKRRTSNDSASTKNAKAPLLKVTTTTTPDTNDQRQLKSSRGRLKKRKTYNDETDDEDELKELLQPVTTAASAEDLQGDVYDPNAIDAPPPGHLPSLWYSQESFLHVFVIEKILAWKIRPKHHHPHQHSPPDQAAPELTLETALKIQEKAIEACSQDQNKRMEISRINALQCPVVLSIWHDMMQKQHKERSDSISNTAAAATTADTNHHLPNLSNREEVFLIKWRGKSYKHCSWERATDLIKFDVASNSTAKGKINRFAQSQELALGKNWKKLLEEGRQGTAAQPTTDGTERVDDEEALGVEEEEYFPSEYLEVERILFCDETEMSMDVFAKQRSLNMKAQKEALELQDSEETCAIKRRSETTAAKLRQVAERMKEQLVPNITQEEQTEIWDPEDYVRYVVKYKSLPMAELHWEYWKDLKHDYVEFAEDFWYRQREPKAEEIYVKPHPEIQEFRKLTESPLFGICTNRPRPIFDFEEGVVREGSADEQDKTSSALQLRSYQLEGVNWLLWNWFNKRSCILADEMGLGKTCQTVSFLKLLSTLDATHVRGPFLVVAPLSLINQWQSEATAWDPDLNIIVYHGHADARAYLQEHEFYYNEPFVSKTTALKLRRQHVTKFHLLITTYEVVMKDLAVLSKIRWRVLVVDEAHRLKNNKSRLFLELGAVPRDFCLLLTGTPLQNSTEELFALLNFADQNNFNDRNNFIESFGQLTDAKQVSDLHAVLKPYLLRRVKEDVAKSLPPKEETILEVSLTPLQKAFYKAIYERNTSFLFKGAKPSNAPSLMNIMMELRKCCNHPFLIRGVEERILSDAANAAKATEISKEGESPSVDMLKIYGEQLVKSSGKMVLLGKLLPKLFDGGHKVLIFSQMVRMLDIIADFLRLSHYKFERLDGSTSSSARNAAVERFNRASCQRFVMLLSTRAGGLGLNLTSADVVIIADSDWNPQNDLQAMARAHRIGQTRAVRVYRLLTAKTYEMHMFHSASMKLGLDRAVLAQQRQNNEDEGEADVKKGKSLRAAEREKQAREIDELLKKGAYDVFRDEDDSEAQQFMETDIDALLERSSKLISYSNTTSTISSGLGSFSKASFVTSTEGGGQDVDLDDPDFWKKAVGLQEPEASAVDDETALLIGSDKKRNRKQVQVYDPYAAYAEAEMKKEEQKLKKEKNEKQEKERIKQEKKAKAMEEEKARKASEKVMKTTKEKASTTTKENGKGARGGKTSKDTKSKSFKTAELLRKERVLENRNPVFERIRYAWEPKHRDLVIDALLRFGFGRFCKIRYEGCFPGLPIQDLEIFLRAYVYVLGLQAAVFLIAKFRRSLETNGLKVNDKDAVSLMMKEVMLVSGNDGIWIFDAISTSLRKHQEVCIDRRMLRIPPTLLDGSFVSKLRNGGALWSLRRLSFLSRLNKIINAALDAVIQRKLVKCKSYSLTRRAMVLSHFDMIELLSVPPELGPEEIGKRGSPTRNSTELDVDMKAKLVTTEELSHAVGRLMGTTDTRQLCYPAPWWDRSCNLALVLGTFIHGLGSYESMGRDPQLPFSYKINAYTIVNPYYGNVMLAFNIALKEATSLFNVKIEASTEALESKNMNASSINNGQAQADLVDEARMNQDKRGKDKLSLDLLVDTISKSFRASVFAESGDVCDASPTGDTLQDRRLMMPDGAVLDELLLSLVELMEANMGISSSSTSAEKNEDCPFILWELTETDVPLKTEASIGQVQSNLFALPSFLDSSSYVHSSAITLDLESSSSGEMREDKQENRVTLGVSRVGIAALMLSSKQNVCLLSDFLRSGSFLDCSPPWKVNKVLRQDICVTLLNVGSPLLMSERFTSVHVDVLRALGSNNVPNVEDAKFFTMESFQRLADANAVNSCDIASYVHDVLLPHCLRLAVRGNDTTTSKGIDDATKEKDPPPSKKVIKRPGTIISEIEYNEDRVVSSYEEALALQHSMHMPDPTMPLEAHSDQAICRAFAIIRRVKLMKAVRFIAGGGVPVDDLITFLKGPVMRKNLDGVPIWWCPWIHDLAVLVNAATLGLFSLHAPSSSGYRRVSAIVNHCLGREAIEKHIQSVFIDGQFGNKPILPQCLLSAKGFDVNHWITELASQLPSARVLERRLALICATLTSLFELPDEDLRYDNVPMFDHGGFPSCCASDVGLSLSYGTSRINVSLLRRVEEDL